MFTLLSLIVFVEICILGTNKCFHCKERLRQMNGEGPLEDEPVADESIAGARPIHIPASLKKTIDKIDQQMTEDNEIFGQGVSEAAAHRLMILERNKALSKNRSASATNAYPQTFISHSCSMPSGQHSRGHPPQHVSQCGICQHHPRRSYSSCAEPVNVHTTQRAPNEPARRCASTRSSPVRSSTAQATSSHQYDSRRSRSVNRRSKSKSRSPVQQFYRREIKINLAQPKSRRQSPEINEEEQQMMFMNNDELETRTVTTTSVQKQPVVLPQPVRHTPRPFVTLPPPPPPPEVQEEVLLNLFSCNNSGLTSSDSSDSIVELKDDLNLKIKEVCIAI